MSTLKEIENWSIWKDRSKELFALNKSIPLPEYEIKDIIEQCERLITNKIMKYERNEKDKCKIEDKNDNDEEVNKLSKFGESIDKIIESKKMEKSVGYESFHPNETRIFIYHISWRSYMFDAISIKSVINYITNDDELFRQMFIDEDEEPIPFIDLKTGMRANNIAYNNFMYIVKNDYFIDKDNGYISDNKFSDYVIKKIKKDDIKEVVSLLMNYYKQYPEHLLKEIINSNEYTIIDMKYAQFHEKFLERSYTEEIYVDE